MVKKISLSLLLALGLSAAGYSVQARDKVQNSLVPVRQLTMQLFIKVVASDRTITIEADPSDTILNIKFKIMDKDGTDPYAQRLIYAGIQLEDSRTLNDYNIQKDTRIFLVVKK